MRERERRKRKGGREKRRPVIKTSLKNLIQVHPDSRSRLIPELLRDCERVWRIGEYPSYSARLAATGPLPSGERERKVPDIPLPWRELPRQKLERVRRHYDGEEAQKRWDRLLKEIT